MHCTLYDKNIEQSCDLPDHTHIGDRQRTWERPGHGLERSSCLHTDLSGPVLGSSWFYQANTSTNLAKTNVCWVFFCFFFRHLLFPRTCKTFTQSLTHKAALYWLPLPWWGVKNSFPHRKLLTKLSNNIFFGPNPVAIYHHFRWFVQARLLWHAWTVEHKTDAKKSGRFYERLTFFWIIQIYINLQIAPVDLISYAYL